MEIHRLTKTIIKEKHPEVIGFGSDDYGRTFVEVEDTPAATAFALKYTDKLVLL
jgi:hypothetical protein